MPSDSETVHLPADTNQARGLAEYAIAFLSAGPGGGGEPDDAVLERTNLFFTDAAVCGHSALALKTNAPTVLREEALGYAVGLGEPGATCFGSAARVRPEKAIVANAAAVREWDSNGTNFGYNPGRGHTAGEFGHNDFYPVAVAAAQMTGADGRAALLGCVCLDEIRGRLAEVFSLKSYKIDHVLHGAVASAAVFGAMLGATAEQIESAIGMTVAHFVPFRAIRAGRQLSDSKGSSAAISTEAACLAVLRSMRGFRGPADIFRNPQAVYRLFEPTAGDASPFDLHLGRAGGGFAVMGMHFKLGLYEHQSAGAIHAVIDLLANNPGLLDGGPETPAIRRVTVTAYEPAFGIIGDPAKRTPTTRQSADHSMVYIIAALVRKAAANRARGVAPSWASLVLEPADYSPAAIADPAAASLIGRVEFAHGGPDYDARYPDGIPTSVVIEDASGGRHDSGLVMYPAGHARNTADPLGELLENKWRVLAALASDEPDALVARYAGLAGRTPAEVAALHDLAIADREPLEPAE